MMSDMNFEQARFNMSNSDPPWEVLDQQVLEVPRKSGAKPS